MAFYEVSKDGAVLRLRVTPNARANSIEGIEPDADGQDQLKVKVRAVPEKGRANAAVIALLAKRLGLPKSAFSVISGDTARNKRLAVSGETAALCAALDALSAAVPNK